jgi:hypothetical protein
VKQLQLIKHQVVSDGRTVWINSSDTGHCLGRFSRWGIDVHQEIDPQGKREERDCIDCTHAKPTMAEWRRFVEGMKEHHSVMVDEHYRPEWLHPADEGVRRAQP